MLSIRHSFGVVAATLAVATLAFTTVTPAEARKGKEVYIQDYNFDRPMHGYSGHKGAFYCDYQRLPKRRCTYSGGRERCKIVGWTLRQMCH